MVRSHAARRGRGHGAGPADVAAAAGPASRGDMPIPSPSQAHEVPRIRACEPKIAASSFPNLQQEGFQVEFEGLKAVVTGGASGIGASVTESLVRRGREGRCSRPDARTGVR